MYNTDFANSHCLLPMQLKSRPDILLLGFITFSLLLHLLLFLLLPQHDLFPVPTRPAPVYVEMRPPKPPRRRDSGNSTCRFARSWKSRGRPQPNAWGRPIRW